VEAQFKYDLLISELIVLKKQLESIRGKLKEADFEIKWYLSQLRKKVNPDDIKNFNRLIGVQDTQIVNQSNPKRTGNSNSTANDESTDDIQEEKSNKNKLEWAKYLYKESVKRCHPDRVIGDQNYKQKLTSIYLEIVSSYDLDEYAELMMSASKVFVAPKVIDDEKIDILTDRKNVFVKKINKMVSSDPYKWVNMTQDSREIYIVNYLKQQGVRFLDKENIKRVLRRKPPKRNRRQKPARIIRSNVKK